MAIALEGATTWFVNSNRLDMRAFDIVQLSNGRIMLAFGGALVQDSVIYTAMLNTTTDQLGAIRTQVIPRTAAGSPASTLRDIELDATGDGDAIVTAHFFNADVNDDTNFSLATQIYDGIVPVGNMSPVNPATPAEDTTDLFATLDIGNGRFVTFFTEPGTTGGWANLSNGIRMATFDAQGQQVGSPVTVVGEFVVFPALRLENNPEDPAAVLLRNGNIGLMYKQTTASGFPEIMFQQLTTAGVAVGDAIQINYGGISTGLTLLEGGRLVATWYEAGGYKAQILSATGAKVGAPIELTTMGNGAYMAFDIVALGNGNFAVSWSDTNLGIHFGQIFNSAGQSIANPFPLLDTIADFSSTGLVTGVMAQGDDLLVYALGTIGAPGVDPQVIQGQLFDGDGSLGRVRTGTIAADTLSGGALDDRLNGADGSDLLRSRDGNDLLTGGNGNDTIVAGTGFDRIDGGLGNDSVLAGGGVDILTGGEGDDRLNGGGGNDLITGGLGADTLIGGTGADQFVFGLASEGRDVIIDFDSAQGDRIRVTLFNFIPMTLTVTDADPAPETLGWHFNTATHVLSFDRDGTGSYLRTEVAVLLGVDTLALTDFLYL